MEQIIRLLITCIKYIRGNIEDAISYQNKVLVLVKTSDCKSMGISEKINSNHLVFQTIINYLIMGSLFEIDIYNNELHIQVKAKTIKKITKDQKDKLKEYCLITNNDVFRNSAGFYPDLRKIRDSELVQFARSILQSSFTILSEIIDNMDINEPLIIAKWFFGEKTCKDLCEILREYRCKDMVYNALKQAPYKMVKYYKQHTGKNPLQGTGYTVGSTNYNQLLNILIITRATDSNLNSKVVPLGLSLQADKIEKNNM